MAGYAVFRVARFFLWARQGALTMGFLKPAPSASDPSDHE
jgi:hypothetical protein